MNVDYELLQRGCLIARENRLKQERIREATPERKAQHKRWAQSEAGRRSDRERSRRYREAHPDRVKANRDRFYAKMMADPEMRERYYARGKRWRDAHKNDPAYKARKYGYEVAFRARQKVRRLNGEHTLWLMGGVVKVNMGRAA